MIPIKPIEVGAMYGQPVTIVADGEFVGASLPLPVTALPETRLITVRDEITQIMTDTTNLRLNFGRTYPLSNPSRFMLQLPSELGRIEYVQLFFTAYTDADLYSTTEKDAWRDMDIEATVQLLETPYKTYADVLANPNDSRWTVLGSFPLTTKVIEGLYLHNSSVKRDAYLLAGGMGPLPIVFPQIKQGENYPFRYLVADVRLYSATNLAMNFGPRGEIYWSAGWTRRNLNLFPDFSSTE